MQTNCNRLRKVKTNLQQEFAKNDLVVDIHRSPIRYFTIRIQIYNQLNINIR